MTHLISSRISARFIEKVSHRVGRFVILLLSASLINQEDVRRVGFSFLPALLLRVALTCYFDSALKASIRLPLATRGMLLVALFHLAAKTFMPLDLIKNAFASHS
jgi:hypothetical protein